MAQPVFDAPPVTELSVASGSTVPIYFGPYDIRNQDHFGIQLETDRQGRSIEVNFALGDNVVASTHTWTFANATFTGGDVGASLRVANAANANNNNTVTISSVSSAHVIVTTGTQTNETFIPTSGDGLGPEVYVIDAGVTALNGTWTAEISNTFVPNAGGSAPYGESPFRGRWCDISAMFSPTFTAVTVPSNQGTQANLSFRSLRFKFTPSSGGGKARVSFHSKAWS